MIKYIVCLFLLLSNSFLYSMDYKTMSIGEIRKLSYENNDFIFMGIPKNVEDNVVTFFVIEYFKNHVGEEVIVKFDNSIFIDNVFSLWLIYGNLENDTILTSNPLSRSIDNPFIIGVSETPTYEVIDSEDEKSIIFEENRIEKKLLEDRWRNEFYDEILILRYLKEERFNKTSLTSVFFKEYMSYIVMSNLFVSIIIVVLLMQCKPRRKNEKKNTKLVE